MSVCEIPCFLCLPGTVNLMKMFPLEGNYKQMKGFQALVSPREGVWSLVGFIPLVHDLAHISHSQSIINSGVSDCVVKPRLVHKYPAVSALPSRGCVAFISLAHHSVSHASDSVFSVSTHALYGLMTPSLGYHFENPSCLLPISGFPPPPSLRFRRDGLGKGLGPWAVLCSGGQWCSKAPGSRWEPQNLQEVEGPHQSGGALKGSFINGG